MLGLQLLFSGLVIVVTFPLSAVKAPTSDQQPFRESWQAVASAYGLNPKMVHIQGVISSAVQTNALLCQSCSYFLVLICFE